MQLEDTVKKWISFFYVLDANRDGMLEVDDIEIIVDRMLNARKGLFNKSEAAYVRLVTIKNFDKLLMEAGSGKERKINLMDWVRMIKRFNSNQSKSHFIRWFSASAVRFLFDLGDHNKDGYIDFDEFETIYKILGLSRANTIFAFKELDNNRDGKLSKLEIYEAITNFFSDSHAARETYLFGHIEKMGEDYVQKLMTV